MAKEAPILDLTAGSLSRPMRLDLFVVEAMMLWPDDPNRRDQWLRAGITEEGRPHIDEMPENLLRQWSRDALDAPQLAKLRAGQDKRFWHGVTVGTIVLNAIGATAAPLWLNIGEVCEALQGRFQVRPQTVNNTILRRYRPVAHFWGAYLLNAGSGDLTFPCGTGDLAVFIATAEAVRALAERSRAKQSPSTVMRPGEAVRLAPGVADVLPTVSVQPV